MKFIHLESTYLTVWGLKISNPAHDHPSTLIKLKAFGTVLYRVFVVCFLMHSDSTSCSSDLHPNHFFFPLWLILFVLPGKVLCGDCYHRGLLPISFIEASELLCGLNTKPLWDCEGILQRLFSADPEWADCSRHHIWTFSQPL